MSNSRLSGIMPVLAILFVFLSIPAVVTAQEVYVDWLTATGTGATFDFASLSGTVTIANPMNGSGSLDSIDMLDGATNYPDTWFSPGPPPVGTEWMFGNARNADGATPGGADWVITFSGPVDDPRFHFVNVDAADYDFSATTTSGGGPVVLTRLSGNPEFEVTGNIVNTTTPIGVLLGCESAAGANPEGGCGTIQLTGTYLSVTFSATDFNVGVSGDGFWWTMSAASPVPVELQSFSIE